MTDPTKVKLLLVTGPGGARMDYVSGWLGTLPYFIDCEWVVDPTTGQSRGRHQALKYIDHSVNLTEILEQQNLVLDTTASLTWAGGNHGFALSDNKPSIENQSIRIAVINVAPQDECKIVWEFYVKTYFIERRGFGVIQGYQRPWAIDDNCNQSLTDEQRIEHVEALIKNHHNCMGITKPNYDFPVTYLDYAKMFVPGGSYYLCQQLGIVKATQHHHDLWDALLPFAASPDVITVWGKTWVKDDYFPDSLVSSCAMQPTLHNL